MSAARLALLPDFPEEHWPSMDLVAEQLLLGLQTHHADQFTTTRSCPHYLCPATRMLGHRGGAVNLDRLFNRFVNYPRHAKKIARDFDLFHVCDHSYGQIVHALPADRTGVFCHDLDTFRCLLDPVAEPRPKWFRAMANRILRGLQRAAIVFHTTATVRAQIEKYSLIDPVKLVQAPLGVAPEFFDAFSEASLPSTPTLLHVGSCIPRKRIDVLLDVFAALHAKMPDLCLLQIGGDFTSPQREQISRLGIDAFIEQRRGLTRAELACLYRSASLVLVTSEAEGFGLPVAEALASGAIVLATDIPVLREVGGLAARYAPLADIHSWAKTAEQLIKNPTLAPDAAIRSNWAQRYSWQSHAAIVAGAYARLVGNQGAADPLERGTRFDTNPHESART
jgi:glycosyltransferase involved in cell wall biosynthesis